MKRREFITLIGGAAAWPLAARAQQPDRVRRIGVLMNTEADDPVGQARAAMFQQALQGLGWMEPTSIRIDYRWRGEPPASSAEELVKLAPDVIVAIGSSNLAAVQKETRTLPIVFALVTDPVGSGFVAALARPGGNTTGFTVYEYTIGPKWLELLKQIAPRVTRVGLLRDASNVAEMALFGAVRSAAPRLDQYRRAASYVDRILKGEKPADLPVQAPTRYELVINLKTAKALDLDMPASVLARANEVIE
jgi:ABC-type uncharacterized transport system substrate-binding protein